MVDDDERAGETAVRSAGSPEPSSAEGGIWKRHQIPISIIVSAVTVAVTILIALLQLRTSTEQFQRTVRQSQYSDIVDGLGSSSIGVQVNSIRRLVQFVSHEDNFDDDDPAEADEAVLNAAQTLMAFIQDESVVAGREGLSDYRDPQPIVVSRALAELVRLVRASEMRIALDLSNGDFHGIHVPRLAPRGSVSAVGADFRLATAAWDLSEAPSVSLGSSFFTCANLQTADFGEADVSGADFTGANLRGADLGSVRGLTSDQLSGALVGEQTRLPPGVEPPGEPWGVVQLADDRFTASADCRRLVESMTRLVSGAGYVARLACPGSDERVSLPSLAPAERAALRRVCRLRARLAR